MRSFIPAEAYSKPAEGSVKPTEVFHKTKAKARITLIETVYHQSPDGPPVAVETRCSHELQSLEQPYVRITKATAEWTKVEYGWVKSPGLLVLKNDGALPIGVACNGHRPLTQFLPGESFRVRPIVGDDWFVACAGGECKMVVNAFPE